MTVVGLSTEEKWPVLDITSADKGERADIPPAFLDDLRRAREAEERALRQLCEHVVNNGAGPAVAVAELILGNL